jgi:hypothetical protein
MNYQDLKFEPDSYKDKALRLLMKGYKLSTLNMLSLVGTLDGRKIIADLKNKYGVPIETKSIAQKGKKPYNVYFLSTGIAS